MDLVEGSECQDGPAYLKLPESEWPHRTDIMSGTVEFPSEELRKQYKHLAFQLTSQPEQTAHMQQPVQPMISSQEHKHELDVITDSTNKWSVALVKTRMLTRWLEISRSKSLTSACDKGWISTLYM